MSRPRPARMRPRPRRRRASSTSEREIGASPDPPETRVARALPPVNEKRPRNASAAAELRSRRRTRERTRHSARSGLSRGGGVAEDDRPAEGTAQRVDRASLRARAEVEVAGAAHAVLELVEPLRGARRARRRIDGGRAVTVLRADRARAPPV